MMARMQERQHLLWIDMAKGLAIALVVLGHCLDFDNPLRHFIYTFHMPLFFMLAGYTMRAKPRLTVLSSSLRRLMVPYLVVCAILLFFAFVPPASLNPNLDPQEPPASVLAQELYASGCESEFMGLHIIGIGAIWFLPCLLWGRLVLNEVLLRTQNLQGWRRALQPLAVLALLWLGFALGQQLRLPMSLDTALVAVGFMYVGYLLKRVEPQNLSNLQWLGFVVLWLLGFASSGIGSIDMATRSYLECPAQLLCSVGGSVAVIGAMIGLEQLGRGCRLPSQALGRLNALMARLGVASLTVLCVHRVESAVFNWQKIMEFFAPNVWSWGLTAQGLYQFALRFTLVLLLAALLRAVLARITAARSKQRRWPLRRRAARA